MDNKEFSFEKIVANLKSDAMAFSNNMIKYKDNHDYSSYISALRSLKDTLNLVKEYDWQLNYSVFGSLDNNTNEMVDMISVWEQNSNNEIRNYKRYRLFSKENLAEDSESNDLISRMFATADCDKVIELMNKLHIETKNRNLKEVLEEVANKYFNG